MQFETPEDHAANPPRTWIVVKLARRRWEVRTADGRALARPFPTKWLAEKMTGDFSWLVAGYVQWGLYFAGRPNKMCLMPYQPASLARCCAPVAREEVQPCAAT